MFINYNILLIFLKTKIKLTFNPQSPIPIIPNPNLNIFKKFNNFLKI